MRAARVTRQHPVIQQRHRVDALRRVLGKCRERTMPDIIIMCVRACSLCGSRVLCLVTFVLGMKLFWLPVASQVSFLQIAVDGSKAHGTIIEVLTS